MKPTCGCGSSGSAGEGPQGLPGLLIAIAFVSIFVFVFLPSSTSDWFLGVFIAVEIGAAVVYVLIGRHNRKESERLRGELHQINEKTGH
jgi:hypothetical protein